MGLTVRGQCVLRHAACTHAHASARACTRTRMHAHGTFIMTRRQASASDAPIFSIALQLRCGLSPLARSCAGTSHGSCAGTGAPVPPTAVSAWCSGPAGDPFRQGNSRSALTHAIPFNSPSPPFHHTRPDARACTCSFSVRGRRGASVGVRSRWRPGEFGIPVGQRKVVQHVCLCQQRSGVSTAARRMRWGHRGARTGLTFRKEYVPVNPIAAWSLSHLRWRNAAGMGAHGHDHAHAPSAPSHRGPACACPRTRSPLVTPHAAELHVVIVAHSGILPSARGLRRAAAKPPRPRLAQSGWTHTHRRTFADADTVPPSTHTVAAPAINRHERRTAEQKYRGLEAEKGRRGRDVSGAHRGRGDRLRPKDAAASARGPVLLAALFLEAGQRVRHAANGGRRMHATQRMHMVYTRPTLTRPALCCTRIAAPAVPPPSPMRRGPGTGDGGVQGNGQEGGAGMIVPAAG